MLLSDSGRPGVQSMVQAIRDTDRQFLHVPYAKLPSTDTNKNIAIIKKELVAMFSRYPVKITENDIVPTTNNNDICILKIGNIVGNGQDNEKIIKDLLASLITTEQHQLITCIVAGQYTIRKEQFSEVPLNGQSALLSTLKYIPVLTPPTIVVQFNNCNFSTQHIHVQGNNNQVKVVNEQKNKVNNTNVSFQDFINYLKREKPAWTRDMIHISIADLCEYYNQYASKSMNYAILGKLLARDYRNCRESRKVNIEKLLQYAK
jgi:hypothetical protein